MGKEREAHPPLWHGLLAGGTSAVTSRLVTYPPDTIKARLQVQRAGPGAQYRSTGHAFVTIAKAEGVPGFYRGFAAILATVVPANMFYFGGYEVGKRLAPKNMGMLSDMATACIAQTLAGIAFNPIDIMKQRLQTEALRHGGSGGVSAVEVAKEVYRNQGLPGFWKGFVTMNVLWLPWNLVYLTLYESSKRRLYRHYLLKRQAEEGAAAPAAVVTRTAEGAALPLPASALEAQLSASAQRPGSQGSRPSSGMRPGVITVQDPPMHEVLPLWAFPLCSSLCSATASICTQPIDVVKTRLQVLSTGAQGQQLSAWQVAGDLWRREGLRGFRRGMAARVLTMAAGSGVSWTTYETVKRHLAQMENK